MTGVPLQSTAQKLIVNTKSFFDQYAQDPTLLDGTSVEKAASVLGINRVSVYQTLHNYKNNAIHTP